MATQTWPAFRDVAVAEGPSGISFGMGAGDTLPVGTYSGYEYESFIRFDGSFTGMTSISSAVLWLKTSNQYKVAFGSDPDIVIQRSEEWPHSEGTATTLSTGNATEWDNKPGSFSANEVSKDVTTSENTWISVSITGIIQDCMSANQYPTIRIKAVNSDASNVTEFWAREFGSNDAYIVVTYTTNAAPTAPSLGSPANGATVAGLTPNLSFTHVDPDGDDLLNYDLQVTTDASFASATHWNISSQTTGISGNSVVRTYAGTALTRGTTYYWRARTRSDAGVSTVSPWSAIRSFKVNTLPTVTLTQPAADANSLAYLSFSAGAGWATPRMVVTWNYFDADPGHFTQSAYKVRIESATTSGGSYSAFYDSGKVVSAVQSLVVPATFVEGDYYKVFVTVWDPLDEPSSETPAAGYRTRVRWGRASYYYDATTAPTALLAPSVTTTSPANTLVVIEYATTNSITEPSTWYSTLAAAGSNRYLWHRMTLMTWGTSPGSPSLDALTFNYNTVAITPDDWNLSNGGQIDQSVFVYGTQSLKITGDGTDNWAEQTVGGLIPGLQYVLSGRVKSVGNSGAKIQAAEPGGTVIVETTAIAVTQDFGELDANGNDKSKVRVGPFTATSDQVKVLCFMNGAATTFAWFDALKLEQSTVATPWAPGYVGGGASIDAGGIQIDTSNGAVFRTKGASGVATDVVEMGDHSWRFNGLEFGGSGTAFPTSLNTAGDRWFRTDISGGVEFQYDGTRWVSVNLYSLPLIPGENLAADSTDAVGMRTALALPDGCSDIWVVDFIVSVFNVNGGTALSGSHFWTYQLRRLGSAGSVGSVSGAHSINSGASSTWRAGTTHTVDALLGSTHIGFLSFNYAKTGTPGNLFLYSHMTYRLVAT